MTRSNYPNKKDKSTQSDNTTLKFRSTPDLKTVNSTNLMDKEVQTDVPNIKGYVFSVSEIISFMLTNGTL